jgi:hypothetical protein
MPGAIVTVIVVHNRFLWVPTILGPVTYQGLLWIINVDTKLIT